MSLTAKLTMTATITPKSSQDQHGDKIDGTPVTGVKCFAFGYTPRSRTDQVTEYTRSFQILFLPTVDLANDYVISDIRSHKGDLVLDSGVVVRVEENYHPKKGLVLKQAYIEKR